MRRKVMNQEILNWGYTHGGNGVTYAVYKETDNKEVHTPKNPTEEISAKFNNSVCFSELLHTIKKEKPNRICYIMKTTNNKTKLSNDERIAWIRMAKDNKILPPYVNDDVGETGIMVLKLTNITPSQLYIYLSALRYIREEPGFIKGMLHLVGELGMDFYAAFILASRICITAPGHHIIDIYRRCYYYGNYGKTKPPPADIEVPLDDMRGLYLFVNNFEKYDKRKVDSGNECYSFSCCDKIGKISKTEKKLKGNDLFSQHVIRAIRANTEKKANEHIEKLMNLKERKSEVKNGKTRSKRN